MLSPLSPPLARVLKEESLSRGTRYALIFEQRAQQVFWLALTMLILPSQCPARASTLLAARNSVSEILET